MVDIPDETYTETALVA